MSNQNRFKTFSAAGDFANWTWMQGSCKSFLLVLLNVIFDKKLHLPFTSLGLVLGLSHGYPLTEQLWVALGTIRLLSLQRSSVSSFLFSSCTSCLVLIHTNFQLWLPAVKIAVASQRDWSYRFKEGNVFCSSDQRYIVNVWQIWSTVVLWLRYTADASNWKYASLYNFSHTWRWTKRPFWDLELPDVIVTAKSP